MEEKTMNAFKTPGREPPCTAGNFASSDNFRYSFSIAKSKGVVLDCTDVTFMLKELDINLSESKTKQLLDAIDTLTVNGIKFIKLESEGKY